MGFCLMLHIDLLQSYQKMKEKYLWMINRLVWLVFLTAQPVAGFVILKQYLRVYIGMHTHTVMLCSLTLF